MTAHDVAAALADGYRDRLDRELAATTEALARFADARTANPDVLDLHALRDVADAFMSVAVTASFLAMAAELDRQTDPQVVAIRRLLADLPAVPEPTAVAS